MRLDRKQYAAAGDLDDPRVATTVRPIGVGARWRMLTSLPTVAHPGGRCALTASPDAISIARIIIGVP